MADPSVRTTQLHNWLARMRTGDLDAREELLRSFSARLERLARKMLRRFPNVQRWAQTEDVLQNALMRLIRSLGKVEPTSVREFLGLAGLEMRRELLDLARHFNGPQGLGANHASIGNDLSHPAAENTPVEKDDQADLERWQAFHEGVEALPTEEREVVSLVFYHEWTQVEVAGLLKISERTVRRRWESALVQLHARLKSLEDGG